MGNSAILPIGKPLVSQISSFTYQLSMHPDFKQVAALFNDYVETIRNEHHEGLQGLAVEWVKGARHKLMRDIEKEYVLAPNSS
jgi:hypothetical protein